MSIRDDAAPPEHEAGELPTGAAEVRMQPELPAESVPPADPTPDLPGKRRRRGRRGGRNKPRRGSRTAAPPERRDAAVQRAAAIDIGTNNCRLLIARPGPEGFVVEDAFSRIVRLGEGLTARDGLAPEAIERTVSALRICAAKIRRAEAHQVRVVATHACRYAGDCRAFRRRVRAETGLEVEIIPPEEEARLAIAGAAPLLDPAIEHGLVFDIGGGSTELMWLRLGSDGTPELEGTLSLPVGVVSLSERVGCDALPPAIYESLVQDIAQRLAAFEARWAINDAIQAGRVQMLGTSGTVTTVAGLAKDLPRYDRTQVDGSVLDFPTVGRIAGELAARTLRERAAHPCIGNQRAEFVVAGCAILEAICRTWPVGTLRVADRGVREGILMELLNGPLVSSGDAG